MYFCKMNVLILHYNYECDQNLKLIFIMKNMH